MRSRGLARFAIIAISLAVLGAGAAHFATPGGWKALVGMPLARDEALAALAALRERVDHRQRLVTRRAPVTPGGGADLKAALPDIEQFKLTVRPPRVDVRLEVFASTEKSGRGSDGWLNDVAGAFNRSGPRLADGRTVGVAVRAIASGTGYEFIAAGKHLPDAFTPSNHLWVEMARAHGVTMTPVRERLVGNVAGVVMRAEVAERLRSQYGSLAVRHLINAVVQGDLVMGYTNPFASSTGLNFLVTVLSTFAEGDAARLLSTDVASAFESFQRGVPFVALTTLQMRESVQRGGSLDAFVMEYQTYARTPELRSGYVFTPFGLRHDNPLYLVGPPDAARSEAIELFARYADASRYRALAREYGFDDGPAHESAFSLPPGDVLVRAQRLWKERKDAGRPIAAVFVTDVSGSMRGSRLNQVRRALVNGAEFIAPTNSIGLVSFASDVTTLLAVKPFDLGHKASFVAAARELRAAGNTAMYDGITVALAMLADAVRANPDVKPLVFVLSDGITNRGTSFGDLSAVVEGLQIPIYTIGYEADLDELRRLSGLVEAASIDAGEGEIEYKIGAMLNAQM